jgi:hypothetical protein
MGCRLLDWQDFGSGRSARRGMEIGANNRDVAWYDSSLGDHQNIYRQMKDIDNKYLNRSYFVQYKIILPFSFQILFIRNN